jgi:hypothetical protein
VNCIKELLKLHDALRAKALGNYLDPSLAQYPSLFLTVN